MKKTLMYGFAAVIAAGIAFSGIASDTSSSKLTELKAQGVEKLCETASTECETPQGVYSNQRKTAACKGGPCEGIDGTLTQP